MKEKMLPHLIYAFKATDDYILYPLFNQFMDIFCNCYIRYPDFLFGLFEVKDPFIK